MVFSCAIATLGLIVDSPAVVIGAMLVAPLLTPMMATAMASLGGRSTMLKNALLALAEGVAVAVILSTIIALLAMYLPFDALATLPHEAQARTRPNPFDLAIALAGGAVGAYSLGRLRPPSDALPGVAIATALMPPLCTIGIGIALGDRGVWGGAALLFVTNLAAIVFAGIVVFVALGFRVQRSAADVLPTALALGLLAVVAGALVFLSLRAVNEARDADRIRSAVSEAIKVQLPGARLLDMERSEEGNALQIRLTVRTVGQPRLEDVQTIQAAVAQSLQRRVAVTFVSVPTLVLDPLNPPPPNATITPTPRPTATSTPVPTPSPSPTATPTMTPSPTPVPSVTPPVTGNARVE